MDIVQTIIAYASWYHGKKEKKGNSGWEDPKFEKEMKSAGWYMGAPWCAFFVLMVLKKVFINEPKFFGPLTRQFNGSAKQTADNVIAAGDFETGDVPEEGCVVVWLLGHGPFGHVGIVKSIDFKSNTMYCIEGNTNGAGSREGDQVNANKPRTIKRDFQPNGLNVYKYIYPRLKK